jgi:hypothetical protein
MEKITNLTIKIPSDDIKILKYPKISIKKIADGLPNNQHFTWNDVNVNKNLCMKIINKAKTSCIIM